MESSVLGGVVFCESNVLTDRLAFLTHSVYMRPSFQGLLWDEYDGLNEDKRKILFLMGWWSDEAVAILFLVIGRQIVQVFISKR